MSTAAFAGFNGQVYISTDGSGGPYEIVGEARDGTLTINQAEIDATSYNSNGWMEYIVGLKSWEMSIEALFLSTNDQGQVDVFDSLIGGTKVWWRFLPERGDNKRGYQGEGIITSWELGVPVDDAVNLSLTIAGSAELESYNTNDV